MKMNVENKLDKVVNILKEKGFVVYRKGGKEPGVFYAKEGDSRIGFVYPNTTFWEDFSIADKYGIAGVKDTYKRAFSEWKDDYKFFTELTLVLNHKIWQHYKSNRELAALYDRLWREADEYAMNNFKGEELDYYYRVTD